ncbi:hypothetical protein [Pseudoalteromonas rubra]|uniref:Uncharacterized protein n=1 Tax=Pseudoalteromonas rubra TaxID=43658 RepID=A0A0F4QDK1_9GAMM|nr:hypothetical protein [Pseudoalteromonas rubra]KJZ05793.1 hypothetical protein TW77_21570 [Pseudoalteromonas rubra]
MPSRWFEVKVTASKYVVVQTDETDENPSLFAAQIASDEFNCDTEEDVTELTSPEAIESAKLDADSVYEIGE